MRNAFLLLLFALHTPIGLIAQLYDDSLSVDRHLIKISQVEYLNGILPKPIVPAMILLIRLAHEALLSMQIVMKFAKAI